MTDSQRIKSIEEFTELSTRALASKIGLKTPQTLYDIHKGKHGISKAVASAVQAKYLNINLEWLLTGDGEMLKQTTPSPSIAAQNQMGLIPLIPIAAQGGSLNDFVESIEASKCEKMLSPVDGVDFAMTVKGDSMDPEYPNGSIIFIKRINERAFIEWGKVYVLDTCNGTVIKEIRKGDAGDCIMCYSANQDPKYQPFDVKFDDMYGMYRVVMCMSMK